MEKFRFKVWRNDYTVTMKIFEQPEETRKKCFLFKHNGVEIHSMDYPQVAEDCIFIRGAILAKDNTAATISFDSLDKAEAYRKKITEALNAYAKELEGDTIITKKTPVVARMSEPTPKYADKLMYRFDRVGSVVVATPISIPEWVNKRTKVYENEVFEILQSTHSVLYDTGFCIAVTANKDLYRQATNCFNTEAAAKDWIGRASRAISECNKKYAHALEPPVAKITKETVIAE